MSSKDLVSVKEADFLDQDPPLRGQNYVCLSFLSPEELLKKKDVFYFEHFLKDFSTDMNDFFGKMMDKYTEEVDMLKTIKERYRYIFETENLQQEFQYFANTNSSTLESEFHEQSNFQTSIRGIKVRGTFDTLREAEIRSQVLKRLDDKFHVYVAQVGCWCPWSPNPDDIAEQEYAETHLNTLMKGYKENQEKKDIFFEERKRELQFNKTKKVLDDKDSWLKNKEASTSTATPSISEITVAPEEPVTTEDPVVAEVPVASEEPAATETPAEEPVV